MLTEASSYSYESVFKISYELFIFDQNTGDTLSKKGENFGEVMDEMGFRSMIDLKTFKDPLNGYLVKNTCMFSVKILQHVFIQTPIECVRPMELVSHEYSWKIENFSKMDNKTCHYKKFTAGDYLWSLRIFQGKDQNVALYMHYHGSIHDPSVGKVSVEFTLSIVDQIDGNHNQMTYNGVLKSDGYGRGNDHISLKYFNDPAQGFIVNETCIIEAKIIVHALVE
ncbi:hypothetical protein KSP40_PGU008257 [Platanthera guangdongensis]|uniref:MATH domain-containing protein n=1 Tax=Platanthera guangdongensis TaxID=2320717 RepID=A0ABR2MCB6_9ASPA